MIRASVEPGEYSPVKAGLALAFVVFVVVAVVRGLLE
jgi:hypothetical protein